MNKKLIFIGSDHGGFNMKESIKLWLEDEGYQVRDMGSHDLSPQDDYPIYAFAVGKEVAQNKDALGILLCRSGGGMVIAANKVKGIRAVTIRDEKNAVHAREHDDANIISIPADWLDENDAKKAITAFLNASFTAEERHQRRINIIREYENKL